MDEDSPSEEAIEEEGSLIDLNDQQERTGVDPLGINQENSSSVEMAFDENGDDDGVVDESSLPPGQWVS